MFLFSRTLPDVQSSGTCLLQINKIIDKWLGAKFSNMIYMKNAFNTIPLLLSLLAVALTSCTNEELTPIYKQQEAGKVIISSYSALPDSVQIFADGKILKIGNRDTFKGRIKGEYDFVFYESKLENISIINKASGETIKSYSFSVAKPKDTISFYASQDTWIENMLRNRPGILSTANGNTGYRFIFPTMNKHSKSGYIGPVDAIIRKANGQILAVAKNITKEGFSEFVEFPFAPPPILNVEIVKHNTAESYIQGQSVIFQMIMQNNKSKLIMINEKSNSSGAFSGIDANINMTDYFDY